MEDIIIQPNTTDTRSDRKKKIAILGCGISALPILKKAREMNIESHCFALKQLSCTNGFVDVFHQIPYENVDEIVDVCKKIRVDGVIASSENTTESTAEVAHRLELPGNRVENGFCGKDKYKMRECLKDSRTVYQPKYIYYQEGMDIKYPVIVKAPDSCGKQGVTLAKNENELNEAISYALSVTSQHQVLIEEYIDNGTEYSVECISSHNRHYVIQITKKDTIGPPHFLEIGHHQPGALNELHYNLIQSRIPEILSAIGVYNSISHVEIKITDDNKLYFIELGARHGGGRIADTLLLNSTDYDYFKGAIQVALDEFEEPKVTQKAFVGIYFYNQMTESLKALFEVAESADWCIERKLPQGELQCTTTNVSRDETSGYMIYKSNHKIKAGVEAPWTAIRINDNPYAVDLMLDFYKRTGRQLAETDLVAGLNKFVEKGNIFAIMDEGKIIAMLNMYCNDVEHKIAYINNVEVYSTYRGNGLSKLIMNTAIEYAIKIGYKGIQLHIAPNNIVAESLYLKLGFVFTGKTKVMNGKKLNELLLNFAR